MRTKPSVLLMLGIIILAAFLALDAGLAPDRARGAAQLSTPTSTPNHFLPFVHHEATPTPTSTPTPTQTPTPTMTPTPRPLEADVFCGIPATPIDPNGAVTSDTQNITTSGTIEDLDIYLQVDHEWVGDLTFTLVHDSTNTSVVLIERPGVPASTFGCPANDIVAVLDDDASDPVEDECAGDSDTSPGIAGRLSPNENLSDFNGESLNGNWTMEVVDAAPADLGTFNVWCMLVVYQP